MRPLQRLAAHPASRRFYSAKPKESLFNEKAHLAKQEPQVTRLPNGIVVASVENYSPVSRIAAVFRAGARYEDAETLGATHCLRIMSSQATKQCSAFGLTRNLNHIGANFACSNTRDHLIYSVDCLRNHADTAAEYLSYASCQPAFKPWEINDNQHRLAFELACLAEDPQVALGEMIHEAAFRNTLGRSLYAPEFRVGNFSAEMLQSFTARFCTSGRLALVGTGVDHGQLVAYAKKFAAPESAPSGAADQPAKYGGGELRRHFDSDLAQVMLLTEGVPAGSSDHLALLVTQQMLGGGPVVKYSSNSTSKLAQAGAAATNQPFAASCVNLSYSDSGLFGISVVGQADDMDKLVKTVCNTCTQFTKVSGSEADFKRAKAQVIANIQFSGEDGSVGVQDLAYQALTSGQVTSASQLVKQVEQLSLADVNKVAKKVINGKASMAAIGNLKNVPYLDELV